MSNTVKIIDTVESFQELISNSDTPVLVDFWATWCPPCKVMNPVLNDIASKHEDVVIAKVDVDQLSDLASVFGITSIPTILSFKEGKLQPQRIIGAVPPAMVENQISSLQG